MRHPKRMIAAATMLSLTVAVTAVAQSPPPGPPGAARPKGGVRITMDELHKHGGVPPGWRFALPDGSPEAGRRAFVELECHKCHRVSGESYPAVSRGPGDVGPDLGGMGANHPREYFAESIVSPNAVIVLGEGHTGPDGLSRMPEYNDVLTVRQLADLVAYLMVAGGGGAAHRHGGAPAHAALAPLKPGERLIELAIAKGKLVDPQQRVIRVRQGEAVRLRWSTDQPTEIHLHGYDLLVTVAPDAPADLPFTARATGRFPLTSHGGGHGATSGEQHGGRGGGHGESEVTLGHLEVLPR